MKPFLSALLIGAIAGALLVWFFKPAVTLPGVPFAVPDSAAIQEAVANQKRIGEGEKAGLFSRILDLQGRLAATGGSNDKPAVSPFDKSAVTIAEIQARHEEEKRQMRRGFNKQLAMLQAVRPDSTVGLYNYDMIMSGLVKDDEIRLLTLNHYAEVKGRPYLKEYIFPRKSRNFEFATSKNPDPDKLDGISMNYNRTFMDFDMLLGGGAGYPMNFYGVIEPRLTFYEVFEIDGRVEPSLTEQPRYRAEIKVKL
jgi:hypothetical protein